MRAKQSAPETDLNTGFEISAAKLPRTPFDPVTRVVDAVVEAVVAVVTVVDEKRGCCKSLKSTIPRAPMDIAR